MIAPASLPDHVLKVFETVPDLYLILSPELTVLTASDAYLQATFTNREAIKGRNIFEVFPENPLAESAKGMANLKASLEQVLQTKKTHRMATQHYDVPLNGNPQNGFVEKYWLPVNTPVLAGNGQVSYIIHRVEDVTGKMQLRRKVQHLKNHVAAEKELQAYLLKLAEVIRPLTDPLEVQYQAVNLLGKQLDACRAFYCEIEPDSDQMRIRRNYTNGVASQEGYYQISDLGPFLLNEYLAGRTVVMEDIVSDIRITEAERLRHLAENVRAFVSVPLVKAGRLVSVLTLNQPTPRQWSKAERAMIVETAERTWAAAERAKAEAALARSEEKYHTLFDSMDEGFCIIEVLFDDQNKPFDWRFLEVNPAFQKNNGLANATGKTILALTPEIEPKWFQIYGRVAQTGEPIRFEEDSAALNRWFSLFAFRVGRPEERKVAVLFNDITQRKKAEAALKNSEEQFRRAIEDAPIPVIMHAEDGEVLQISRTWTELTGYRPEEVPTFDNWLTQAYGNGANAVRGLMQDLFYGNHQILNLDFSVATRSRGVRHWSLSASSPGILGDGRRFIVGMAVDITERKEAEQKLRRFNEILEQQVTDRTQALQESKDLLRAIAESQTVSISAFKAIRNENFEIVDLEWTFANPVTIRLGNGLNFPGTRFLNFFPKAEEKGILKEFRKVIETDSSFDQEYYYHSADVKGWFRIIAVKLGDGLLITTEDISERKNAEKELRESKLFAEQVMEASPDFIMIFNLLENKIDFVNRGAYQEDEIRYRETLAISYEQLLARAHPDDRQALHQFINSFRTAPDNEVLSLDYRVVKNGTLLWYRSRGKVFKRNQAGIVTHYISVIQDITSVKQLQEENLKMRLEQQKALLLAILEAQEEERRRISESLHNGVGQLLYATKLNLQSVTGNVPENGLKVVEELLSEAISETRRVSHELVPVLLQDFGLEDAVYDLCKKTRTPDLLLCFSVEGLKKRLEPYLEVALYRIAQELLANILKHAHATEADLLIRLQDRHLLLKVRDNGQGFNPNRARKKGIGLRTIRDRVNLLNGTMEITKPEGGKGMLVSIRIPL